MEGLNGSSKLGKGDEIMNGECAGAVKAWGEE